VGLYAFPPRKESCKKQGANIGLSPISTMGFADALDRLGFLLKRSLLRENWILLIQGG